MLTARQKEILDFVLEYTGENGYPPSVREIGRRFGVNPATVQDHIKARERKGALERQRFKSRTLSPPPGRFGRSKNTSVPLVGRVAAGMPIAAEENIERFVQLPADWTAQGAFLLQVRGNSMENAHILDGDYVLVAPDSNVRTGEIVVALVEGDATVKRFLRKAHSIVLQPENDKFEPIEIHESAGESVRIVGRVTGVLRMIGK